ncbi:hypothetical protein GCM10017044_20710 [Kordiimonas sediminis]|uniref:Response regulatory domain-containing protein n=1 Tax=Kordiimonas sediminis TaxID=1735581 RepID=A0A919E8V0_9PROT|nr:Hpt domain-containing protein [Kordiimonas sediminis]GHF25747.1 hypothetical protein GCM10017044_20710 [Kordiimonas sediminis]
MMDDEFLDQLRNEAIDTVEDKLGTLNTAIDSAIEGSLTGADLNAALKIEARSLKSAVSSFDMKALAAVCHRFEDYIFDIKEFTPDILKSVQIYSDRMSDCLEAFVQGRAIDISLLVRELPAKREGFEVSDVTVTDIEVMLVMEPGLATKIVTTELLECGYRIINVASTMDAIQLIPSMRPDMVIVNRVMPELTGIDLVCALKAMPTTRDIPVALIASADRENLEDLPANVPVLRKGNLFGEDVADVFVQLGIL